jgi:hypothetical protein
MPPVQLIRGLVRTIEKADLSADSRQAIPQVSSTEGGRSGKEPNRGRDAHYCTPPAQNRTCGIPAYGSHLGCLTRKRWDGQG